MSHHASLSPRNEGRQSIGYAELNHLARMNHTRSIRYQARAGAMEIIVQHTADLAHKPHSINSCLTYRNRQ